MAEIHVQAKKKAGLVWFWIVLFLVILAAIVVYVMYRDDKQVQQKVQTQSYFFNSNDKNIAYLM